MLRNVNLFDTQIFGKLSCQFFISALSHSPVLPQTLLVFSVSLAPSLPAEWGPQVGEKRAQRRREGLFFPYNNRGIHGHPAPHQSTER